MPSDQAPADLEECERRSKKLIDLAESTAQNAGKKLVEVGEDRLRVRWGGSFTTHDPGRWAKVFGPGEAPSRLEFPRGIVADWGLEMLKPEEGALATTLWWLVKIGKAGFAIRKATPIGVALEVAFFLYDVSKDVGEWKAERDYQDYIKTNDIDVPHVNLMHQVIKLRQDCEKALTATSMQEIRSGGAHGAAFRRELFEYLRLPKENQRLATGVIVLLGRHHFGKRLEHIRSAMLHTAVNAFAARAWGVWLEDQSRHPAATTRLAGRGYTGPVDLDRRRHDYVKYSREMQNTAVKLAERTRDLASELNYVSTMYVWFANGAGNTAATR